MKDTAPTPADGRPRDDDPVAPATSARLGDDRTRVWPPPRVPSLDAWAWQGLGHAGRGLMVTLSRLSHEVPPEDSKQYDAFVDGLNAIVLREVYAWQEKHRCAKMAGTKRRARGPDNAPAVLPFLRPGVTR